MKQIYKKKQNSALYDNRNDSHQSAVWNTMEGIAENVLAWWGSIYPEFCFSEWDQYGCDVEKFPSEQRPKISFWLAKAIERW